MCDIRGNDSFQKHDLGMIFLRESVPNYIFFLCRIPFVGRDFPAAPQYLANVRSAMEDLR